MTEVLITVLLVLITLLTLMPMLFMGSKSTKVTKNRTVEMKLAQEEIENFNSEKFSILLKNIINKLPNTITPESFIKGEKSYIEPKFIYVNPSTGEIKDNTNLGNFNKLNIKKTYSYLIGSESLLDDAIQLLVEIQIEGKPAKPVSLRAIVNRDKL